MLNFKRSSPKEARGGDGVERSPDGNQRLSFWDPNLKDSRKKYFKITGIVSIMAYSN